MKLYNIKNINRFFEAVKECKGDVNMVLPDEVVNLKNDVKTYSNIFSNITASEGIPELDIRTDCSEDTVKLLRFAIAG